MLFEQGHLVWRCDYLVESNLAFGNLLDYFFVAKLLYADLLDFLMEFLTCKHTNLYNVAQACWQDASATDVLIGLGRIDIHLDNQLEAF